MSKAAIDDVIRGRFVRPYDLRALARSFPTLAETPSEFFEDAGTAIKFAWGLGSLDNGAHRFADWARSGGGGQRDAALFVLSIWDFRADWGDECGLRRDDGPTGGRFDVHRALGNWDPSHRAAFLAWARAPWWL